MRHLSLALCLAFAACDDGEKTDDTGPAGTDCATVAPADCPSTAGCETFYARPFEDDGAGGSCVDFSDPTAPVACQNATDTARACGDAETPASADSAPDVLYLFNNTCIPDGWTVIGDYGAYSECE